MENEETEYNIHHLLYDITRGHFKSKKLCKLGLHNYQYMMKKTPKKPIVEKDGNLTIIKHEYTYKTFYQCYCCGKRCQERKLND